MTMKLDISNIPIPTEANTQRHIDATRHHIPKVPSDVIIQKLTTLTINTEEGKVYNWDGRELGKKDTDGRVHISISGTTEHRRLRRSHIIWWKAKGYWPTLTIDHQDKDCSNDRIGNLQEATMKVQGETNRTKK